MTTLVKPKVSSVIRSQLPEYIREDYQTFLSFLEAYYEYLDSSNQDLKTLRDLDTTLDSFIKHFKNELAPNLPDSSVDIRFLLKNIKGQYLAKGSEASFKLLFKILYDKDVSVEYPSTQILRASDGKWNQDVSVFAKVLSGSPDDVVGKLVDVVTPNKIIRVLVDRRQYVEIEIDRVNRVSGDTYEFLIDRRFFGNVEVGDRLRYRNDSTGTYFSAEIVATTSKLEILQAGSGFKVGDIYNIKNFNGTGSIMKVSAVDGNGGIARAQFIKFGIGYSTDFTTTISSLSGQDLAGTAGTVIQRVGNNLSISEGMDGFAEFGTFNLFDYCAKAAGETGTGPAFDGTYAGTVLREFGISSIDSTVTDTNPAIIKCSLGALAKYPGYYVNNDSFLDDAVYVQDSRYYQAYSYVIKIDEKLDTYKTVVKNLIHPSGMAVFGEYDIRNEFDISLQLESLIKILAIVQHEELKTIDAGAILTTSKPITDSTLNYDGFAEGQSVTLVETGLTLDGTRTMPYLVVSKPIIDTTLNYNGVADTNGQYVTMSELTSNYQSGSRIGAEIINVSKSLTNGHFINDGVTVDPENLLPLDEVGSGTSRTVPYIDVSKTLNQTTFNYDGVLDDNTTPAVEPTFAMGYTAVMPDGTGNTTVRTGLSIINSTKILNSTASDHYLFDGVTLDTDVQYISDTNATSATDLNRTTPAFSLTTTLPTAYYISASQTYAGDNTATMVDNGGFLDFNPYVEAGYALNDGGLYVGTQINF